MLGDTPIPHQIYAFNKKSSVMCRWGFCRKRPLKLQPSRLKGLQVLSHGPMKKKLCCSLNCFPWRSRLIRQHHLPVWGHGFEAACTRLLVTKCCSQLTVLHWSTWKKVESLRFLPNGQVFPWHKKPTHRYIWLLTGILMGSLKGRQWVEMTMES